MTLENSIGSNGNSAFKASVLIAEGQSPSLSRIMKAFSSFPTEGFNIASVTSQRLNISGLIEDYQPDLLIIGDNMPPISLGVVETVRALRNDHFYLPIVVIGGNDLSDDMLISHYDAGADLFLPWDKYGDRELKLRARAIIKRAGLASERAPSHPLINGSLEVDFAGHQVTLYGEEVHLTYTEYKILTMLARNCGRTVLQEELIRGVWGEGESPHILRVNISRLREELRDKDKSMIVTSPGIGYYLRDFNSPYVPEENSGSHSESLAS